MHSVCVTKYRPGMGACINSINPLITASNNFGHKKLVYMTSL